LGCVLKTAHDETLALNLKTQTELEKIKQERDQLNIDLNQTKQDLSDVTRRNEELSQTNLRLVTKNKTCVEQALESSKEILKTQQQVLDSEDLAVQLKNVTSGKPIDVLFSSNQLWVNIPEEELFASGKMNLLPSGKKLLSSLVATLKTKELQDLQVQTSLRPSSNLSAAWEVSFARASAVACFFKDSGIQPSQLVAVSSGETPSKDQLNVLKIRVTPADSSTSASPAKEPISP
jgi:outer membrane protein OmpA-like peptidoglycan-associated protein